jgi:lipopolysaccharide transport system permease protein
MSFSSLRVVIEPGHTERYFWRDLWRYRELFFVLAWRDLTVRYKQTVLGLGWAVIKPMLTIVALTIVFSLMARLPSEGGAPYALLVFSGLLGWNLVTNLFSETSNSLLFSANVISKVYFPRLIIPAATIIPALVDFFIGLILFFIIGSYYGAFADVRILYLPIFVALAVAVAFGPGLLFAALNVKYRDLRNVLPFLVQTGLYISPVGFSSTVVPEQWRLIYSMNPVVGVLDGFRWSLLSGSAELYWPSVVISIIWAVAMLALGVWRFRKTERIFADLI